MYENPPFLAAARDNRTRLLEWARLAATREPAPPYCDSGDFRFTATPVALQPGQGILLTGTPLERAPDPRMHALPGLLRFTGTLAPNAANLHRFMERLVGADPALFGGAVLFASRGGGAFLPLHTISGDGADERTWMRWPCERLFVKRRAAVITNPVTGTQALAIPFLVPPQERYVVLAPLRTEHLSRSDSDFLAAVQCIAGAVPLNAPAHAGLDARDRVDVSGSAADLRVLYFGRSDFAERLAAIVEPWSWRFERATTFTGALEMLDRRFDLAVFDGGAVGYRMTSLHALRRYAPDIALLYIGPATDESELLADACIPADIADVEVVRILKRIARELPPRRWQQLQSAIDDAAPVVLASRTLLELAERVAATAIEVLCDYACVHILDDEGTVFASELPPRPQRILADLPDSFLSGYAIVTSRIDDAFFAGISSDPHTREQLEALAPLSGALLPIAHEGRLVGSIVALATQRTFDEPQAGAFSKLAALASRGFAALQTQEGPVRGSWTRLTCGSYDIEAFSAAGSTGITASLTPGGNAVAIDLRGPDHQRFTGTLDAREGVLRFNSANVPHPFHVRADGPPRSLHVAGGEQRMPLPSRSITIIFAQSLSERIERPDIAPMITRALADDRDVQPAAELARALSKQRTSFAIITSM